MMEDYDALSDAMEDDALSLTSPVEPGEHRKFPEVSEQKLGEVATGSLVNTQRAAEALAEAIEAGEEERAAEIARRLCSDRARLQIRALPLRPVAPIRSASTSTVSLSSTTIASMSIDSDGKMEQFLQSLTTLGFSDHEANAKAFTKFHGDLLKATDWLSLEPAERKQKEIQEQAEAESFRLIAALQKEEEELRARDKARKREEEEKATAELLRMEDEDQKKKKDEAKRKGEEEAKRIAAEEEKAVEVEKKKRKDYHAETLKKSETLLTMLQKVDPKSKTEPNLEPFDCPICMTEIDVGEGIILRSCQHQLCKDCIKGNVESNIQNGEYPVKCPNVDCRKPMAQADVRAIVGDAMYDKLEGRMIGNFEAESKNAFHCKTNDCKGWCEFEETALTFNCPLCKKSNCIPCKALHPKQNCKQYQEDLKRRSTQDEDAKKTQAALDEMVKNKEALRCPGCKILVMKMSGCDWMQCRMCKTEICWATMGARWGPKGHGDKSGGCGCVYPAKKCHPKCGNCH